MQYGASHHTDLSAKKWPNQTAKPFEYDVKPKSRNIIINPTCTLYGPVHNMNSRQAIQAQAKTMEATWLSDFGGGGRRIEFMGAKKC